MASTKIDDFYATISKYGQAKPNRFECEVYLPELVRQASNTQLPRDLNLRIVGASFPGKNIRTTTDENIYGPSYEVAQGLTYGEEITLEFLLKQNHEERLVFNAWQDFIVSPTTYNVSYYNDYVSNIRVYQLDEQGHRTAGIEIRNCFPKTVNAIEYNMDTTSQLIKSTVGMSFKEWVPLASKGTTSGEKATWVVYDEYNEKPITRSNVPRGTILDTIQDGADRGRAIGGDFVDSFPGRNKGMFEDAGKAFNDVLAARDKVVFAQQKVVAFKNFFKGITRNPLSNLGIGRGRGF
tara:strand:+ start:231 stop:1112 length:882 start_codon:yes stop_codon:yes gene_type:complete